MSENDQLMDVEQLAEYLGLAPQTIYNKVHRREIPYLKAKAGGPLRFRKSDIDAWLEANTVQPQSA